MGFRSFRLFISVDGSDTLVRLGSVSVESLGLASPSGDLHTTIVLVPNPAVGAKGKAAPAATVTPHSPGPLGFGTYRPFLTVLGTGLDPSIAGDVAALGKAGVAGTIGLPGVAGFASHRPYITLTGADPLVVYDLAGDVGAFALSGLTGDALEPLDFILEESLAIGSLAKAGVAGSVGLTGAGGYGLGNVSVEALGKSTPAANLTNSFPFQFVINVGPLSALGRATIPDGNVFQPIEFNLGNVSITALGRGSAFAYAIGQPAVADFVSLESGAYGMPTTVNIWNMALSHIGSKHFVESETERSREVSVLKVHWAAAVNKVLADHPWTFARKYAYLGLIREDPNGDWHYAYRYPADCVHARRIVSEVGGRRDPDPPPFTIGQDNWGRLVYTDWPNAVLEYTMRVFETERYDAQFTTMLSWYLAHLIANPLSRISGSAGACFDMYKAMKSAASTISMNESQQDDPQEAEWIQARV